MAADHSSLLPSTPANALASAQRVMKRCELLARHSEEPDRLTRPYGTASLRAAQNEVAAWMESAGMETRRDAIGNLIGRYPGRHNGPPLLLGSHLDTVRNAGRYDGMLGVLVAIAVVENLQARNAHLPFPVEVVAFADEEGLRFHTPYLASRFLIGALNSTTLALRDRAGVTLQEAVQAFGGDPSALLPGAVVPSALLGYVECHLEQGPVLEHIQLPVGVVSAIAGQCRATVTFVGQAGHAGTVPMDLRRDPLGAAAEFVLVVEGAAREREGAVATIGEIAAEPGASNVIPGRVSLTLDIRHQEDVERHALSRYLESEARAAAGRRGLDVEWRTVEDQPGVTCDLGLTALLAGAVASTGLPVHQLTSGAGHDAVPLSALAPVAMLFVRCAGGISHHPDEFVSQDDTAVAIDVLDRFLAALAQEHYGRTYSPLRSLGRGRAHGTSVTHYDLLVRNGSVVRGSESTRADLAVVEGWIVAIGPELDGTSRETIDASGLHLLPGLIDAHVHLNEPGRTGWEGFASGTAALAAGGATSCFDMPLNASPPTLDGDAFDHKLAAATASSLVDFGLWGGIVPGNLDSLEALAERGAIGFKAFMSNSGIDDFPAVDDLTLLEGMAKAAQLGLVVAVHAENDEVTSGLTGRANAEGRTGWRDYLASRPVVAELEAISRAITFAEETGCALHIVHVSTGRGVALVAEARSRGINVSCETCPHYLVLTEEDLEHLGALAKCAPPLRSASDREALWASLVAGELPMIASDHSPAPPDLKTKSDAFSVWGGVSGAQSTLPLLLTEGHHARKVPLATIAEVSAGFVARRFDLSAKGRLEIGADADFALIELDRPWVLGAEDLQDRHRHNPYVEREFRGRVVRTVLRGITTVIGGKIVSGPVGRLLTPAARSIES